MNKINLYIFNQIVKSCTLVFFIFLSISWLMQLSRLFSIMNNLHVEFLSILNLSFWLIPNLLNVTLPFIIILGLVLAFIKFHRDNEIIAIFSLGLTLKEIRKPIILLSLIMIIFYFLLNFIFSPMTYGIYKENEFKLRNSIDFNKINISNFIELDNNIVIDFENKNNNFLDILINIKDNKDNLIYAKRGIIENDEKQLIFTLIDGYKIIVEDQKIEKLKFDNYKIEFPSIIKKEYRNFDKNTVSLNEIFLSNHNLHKNIITEKIFDILIIVSFIFYFYFFIIKKNNFSLKSLIFYIIISIVFLTSDHFIANLDLNINKLLIYNLINVSMIFLSGITFKFIKL